MKVNGVARLLACAALLALVASQTFARPGGGNTYSGRSPSSSSSGSASSTVESNGTDSPPEPGRANTVGSLPIENYLWGFVGFTFFLLYAWTKWAPMPAHAQMLDVGGRSSLSAPPAPPPQTVSEPVRIQAREEMLNKLRESDPDFSMVLFEDFASTLYVESQRARHDPRALAGLAPYWSEPLLTSLADRPPKSAVVDAAIVGMLRPRAVMEEATRLCIECEFEVNLHLTTGITQYVSETWSFSRERNARTKPWTGVRKLGCPNCGAPLATGGDTRCPSCGEASGGGRFDWQVTAIELHSCVTRPHSFTGTAEEAGIFDDTRFAPFLGPRRDELFKSDPALSAKTIEARVRMIFAQLQATWAAQDLRPLRPFVTDRHYDALSYWIDAYKGQGLRNLMDSPQFRRFVFVRVERDKHYDAITLRIWATGCDYTIDQRGEVVGGSRTVERDYSEYWTLVRSASARGTPRLDQNCPGCGVPLTLNMAGSCEHCGAHVTSGEFDWVLSRIEQDESYRA